MSITPGTDNAPDPAPLMTTKQQLQALELLLYWREYDEQTGPNNAWPMRRTSEFLNQFKRALVAEWQRS